jgi:hypothetical protein
MVPGTEDRSIIRPDSAIAAVRNAVSALERPRMNAAMSQADIW